MRFTVCSGCGFMVANPWPRMVEIAEYYARSSSASGAVYRETRKGSRQDLITTRRAEAVEEAWRRHHGGSRGTHLDVGCGIGHLVARLSAQGWRSRGLEPSEPAVKAAASGGLDVCLGSAEDADLPAASFDLVTCMSTLEHVWNVGAAIAAMAHWLKPDGLLVAEVPDASQPWPQLTEFYSYEHLSQFTEGTLAEWFARRGFAVLETHRSELSERSRPATMHVRVVATIGEGGESARLNLDRSREHLTHAIEHYDVERQRLVDSVAARLDEHSGAWGARGAHVGIYGGGWHTRYLLDAAPIAEHVTHIIDSDPRKRGTCFLGWEIIGPDDIRDAGVDAVVISSAVFEEEIADRLKPLAEDGLEVVRLYT